MNRERLSALELIDLNLSNRTNPTIGNLPGDSEARRREIQELLDAHPNIIISRQYTALFDGLQDFHIVDREGDPLKGGIRFPCKDAIAESFSADQLQLGVSQNFRNPTLLVVPQTRFQNLVTSIDDHRLPKQTSTLIAEPFKDDTHSDQIEGWTPMIVEGAQGSMLDQRLGATYEAMIEFIGRMQQERAEISNHFSGIDRNSYAMLMILSMQNARGVHDLIDRNGATILDGDPALDLSPETDRGVPIGKYRKNEEGFRYEDAVSFHMSQGRFGGNSGYGGHWLRNAVAGKMIA